MNVAEMTLDDAMKNGAIALFHENMEIKFGNKYRDYHKEVCGGTHIERTGQIVLFKITSFQVSGRI